MLVIIGLIVGGVLVGRDLITTAQNRAGISQIEKYQAAVQTFIAKYDCIPGDCAKAVDLGLGTSGGVGDNGDGDGSVFSNGINGLSGGSWADGREVGNFWYHLYKAHLTADNVTGYISPFTKVSDYTPKLKFAMPSYLVAATGTYNAGDIALGNMFIIVAEDVNFWGSPPFNASTAYWIDAKIDDGLPLTGRIRDREWNVNYIGAAFPETDGRCGGGYPGCDLKSCGTTNQYDILGTLSGNPSSLLCSLSIGMAW